LKNNTFRVATPEDLPFLKEMLYEAVLWSQPANRPPLDELLSEPELERILHKWGKQTGNFGIVALNENNNPIGAVWYRFFTKDNPSFGFVDENTPELGIAVKAEMRSKGIGKFLLEKILSHAKEKGILKISLSVQPENFARLLYEKVGFYKVATFKDAWTMVVDL